MCFKISWIYCSDNWTYHLHHTYFFSTLFAQLRHLNIELFNKKYDWWKLGEFQSFKHMLYIIIMFLIDKCL